MNLAIKKVILTGLLILSGIVRAAAEPTKLMDLVKTGPSLEEVQKVLADRNELREINKQSQAGATALMLFTASASKIKDKATKEAIIEELLSKGADERSKDRNNKALLTYAVESGDPDIIQLVLNKPELKNSIDDQDSTGSTALHYLILSPIIRDAALKTNLIKEFISKGADPKIKNRDGKSILIRALDMADMETIQLLLNNPEWININDKDNAGNSALTLLAASTKIQDPNTKIKLMETLISKGADVTITDANGKTVFLIAIEQKDLDIVPFWLMVQFWLDAAKTAGVKKMLSMWDKSGKNALYVAVENKQLALIEKLINKDLLSTVLTWHGANPDNKTPLMKAIEMGWIDGVQAIVKNTDSSHLNAQDAHGRTPFYYAVESKSLPILMLILSKKYDSARTANVAAGSDKKTSLLKAVELQWLEGVQAIINQHPESLSVADAHGRTPLMRAAEMGWTEGVQLLLSKNVGLDLVNKEGKTALRFAVDGKRFDVVKLLADKGANIGLADLNGVTPLMVASRENWTDGIKLLVDKGTQGINAVDKEGKTALMYLAHHFNIDMIKLLEKNGANTTLKDKHGKDAFAYALENSNASAKNDLVGREEWTPSYGSSTYGELTTCTKSTPFCLGNQCGFYCSGTRKECYQWFSHGTEPGAHLIRPTRGGSISSWWKTDCR